MRQISTPRSACRRFRRPYDEVDTGDGGGALGSMNGGCDRERDADDGNESLMRSGSYQNFDCVATRGVRTFLVREGWPSGLRHRS